MFRAAALGLVCWGAYSLFSNRNASPEAKNSSSILSFFRSIFSVAPKPAMPLNPPLVVEALEANSPVLANSPVSLIASTALKSPEISPVSSRSHSPEVAVAHDKGFLIALRPQSPPPQPTNEPCEPLFTKVEDPKPPLITVLCRSPEKPKFIQNRMPADGNCFFHSLQHHFGISHTELRGMVARFLDESSSSLPPEIARGIQHELAEIAAGLALDIDNFKKSIPLLQQHGGNTDIKAEFSERLDYQLFIKHLNFTRKPNESDSDYLDRLYADLNFFATNPPAINKKGLDLFKPLVSRDISHVENSSSLPPQIATKIQHELAEIAGGLGDKIRETVLTINWLEQLGQRIDLNDTFSHVKEFQPFIEHLNFTRELNESNTKYLERLIDTLTHYATKSGPLVQEELNLFKKLISGDKFHAGQGVIEIMAFQLGVEIAVYNWNSVTGEYDTHPEACSTYKGEATIHLQREDNHYNYLEPKK